MCTLLKPPQVHTAMPPNARHRRLLPQQLLLRLTDSSLEPMPLLPKVRPALDTISDAFVDWGTDIFVSCQASGNTMTRRITNNQLLRIQAGQKHTEAWSCQRLGRWQASCDQARFNANLHFSVTFLLMGHAIIDTFLATAEGPSAMSTPSKGLSHLLQRPLSSRCLARSPAGLAHVEEGLCFLRDDRGGKVSNLLQFFLHAQWLWQSSLYVNRLSAVDLMHLLQGEVTDTPAPNATNFTSPKPSPATSQRGKPAAAQLPLQKGSHTVRSPTAAQPTGVRTATSDHKGAPATAGSLRLDKSNSGVCTTDAGKHRLLVPNLPLMSPRTAELMSAPAKPLPPMQRAVPRRADEKGMTFRAFPKKALFRGEPGLSAETPACIATSVTRSSAEETKCSRQEPCTAPVNFPKRQQGLKSEECEMPADQNMLSVFSFL